MSDFDGFEGAVEAAVDADVGVFAQTLARPTRADGGMKSKYYKSFTFTVFQKGPIF